MTKLPYHSGIEGSVKADPTSAAVKQTAMNASNASAGRAGPIRLRFLVLPTIVPPVASLKYSRRPNMRRGNEGTSLFIRAES